MTWGKGTTNNSIGWGKGADSPSNSWGKVYASSNSGDTDIQSGLSNTVAPVISGTNEVGETLSCTTGTWSGGTPITYAYQWKRDGVSIGSATSSTYVLVSADAETDVTCTVTATNAEGSNSATSNTITIAAETDPDAQAFITAASITDPTQQTAVNQLVVDLKAASLWTKMKAVYPFVGGSASTHKWNLKDPRDLDAAFRIVFIGGWTHSSTGAKPNGTNGYASTFIVANTLTQNSTHLSTYLRDNTAGNEIDISTGAYDLYIGASYSSFGYIGNIHNTGLNDITSTDSRGLNTTSRISSTNYKHYKNGSSIGTINASSSSPSANTIVLGKGAPDWSTRQTAFASIGDGLSDTDVSNLDTAVQAFQVALSRSV